MEELVQRMAPTAVQAGHIKPSQDPCLSSAIPESASAPSTFTRSAASYRHRRYHHRVPTRPRAQQASYGSLPLACDEPDEWVDGWRAQWRGRRSGSLFSLPNLGSSSSRSTCSSPGPSPVPHHGGCSLARSSSLVPPFRLNVDALVGAEETDVDTGNKVNPAGAVDLTVVSAYVRSGCRPPSAPPEDVGPSLFPGTYKAATLGRTPNAPSAFLESKMQSSSVSINQSDSCSVISATIEETHKGEEEEVQEFYI